jgi:GNAT superfamily N-acetyltransferase
MSSLIIRQAQEEDAQIIAQLINELAKYEKLEGEATPSLNDLSAHLAPDANPALHCLLAEMDGKPAGFALYFFHYSTFRTNWGLYLEDIFVREEFRRKGVGSTLFKEIGVIANKRGCVRLDLQVLDWNTSAIDFYKRWGGRDISEWKTIRFEGEALKRLDT